MTKTLVEVFTEARELLASRGVATGMYYDSGKNQYCSLGAVRKTSGWIDYGSPITEDGELVDYDYGTDKSYRLSGDAETLLTSLLPEEFEYIAPFNDASTQEEVLDVFDRAIALAADLEKAENG
jgi:hypothetical protein